MDLTIEMARARRGFHVRADVALRGSELGEFWKLRIGDFLVIATIRDAEVLILVVRVDRRDQAYHRPR